MNPQADALRQAGFTALKAGRLEEATNYLRQAIGLDPNSYETCAYLGAAYSQAGNHESARRMFGRCVQINPSSAKARFNLGKAHLAAGDQEAARTCFEAALELDASYANAREALGQLPPKVVSMSSLSSPGGSIHMPGAAHEDARQEEEKSAEPKKVLTPAEIAKLSMPGGHLHMMSGQASDMDEKE